MTKKDFEAIAKVIRSQLDAHTSAFSVSRAPLVEVAKGIAEHAIERQPKFQRGRFLKACGLSLQEY